MLKLTIIDILLAPIFIVLLNVLVRFVRNRYYHNHELGEYLIRGFRIKLVFGILFALFSILIVAGDTEMYYTAGIDFKKIVLGDFNNLHFIFGPAKDFGDYYEANGYRAENYGYVGANGNLMAIKMVALFSILSFNSYLIISIFFSLFSFVGLWLMFRTFYAIYPSYLKALFITFFFIPSVLFWGSGILKDTLCIGFLGIGFYNAFQFFLQKKYRLKTLIAFLVSFYCLYVIKSYVALSFIASFGFWFYLQKLRTIKSSAKKLMWLMAPVALLAAYIAFGNFEEVVASYSSESIAENIEASQHNYSQFTSEDGAMINYGEIVPTPAGIAKLIPQALVASLFRPFLWESKKITSLIAAVEGAFFFGFTIFVFFKKGLWNSLKIIFTDSTILFCFFFSLVFAVAIGLNCFNLGTLVRYKIPCLPFYLLSLVLILKKGTIEPSAVVVQK
jgi:hypothetical protein